MIKVGKKLTEAEKIDIQNLHMQGKDAKQIAARVNRSEYTVKKVIRQFEGTDVQGHKPTNAISILKKLEGIDVSIPKGNKPKVQIKDDELAVSVPQKKVFDLGADDEDDEPSEEEEQDDEKDLKILRRNIAKNLTTFEKAIFKVITDKPLPSEEESMLYISWKGVMDVYVKDTNQQEAVAIGLVVMAHLGIIFLHSGELKDGFERKRKELENSARKKQEEPKTQTAPLAKKDDVLKLSSSPPTDFKEDKTTSKPLPVAKV